MTHRDYASAVTIITGHERSDRSNDLDWSKLADLDGTLVILMGISNLENNIKHLIHNGKDARTPVLSFRTDRSGIKDRSMALSITSLRDAGRMG